MRFEPLMKSFINVMSANNSNILLNWLAKQRTFLTPINNLQFIGPKHRVLILLFDKD